MTYDIPPAIEQQAISTIAAIDARGVKYPYKLTSTAKQIAVVVLAKWDINNTKMQRILTNRLVAHCLSDELFAEHGDNK